MEFRDLQIEYGVAKEDFPEWYKRYRVFLHEQAELKHIEMILKYGDGTPPMQGLRAALMFWRRTSPYGAMFNALSSPKQSAQIPCRGWTGVCRNARCTPFFFR